MLATRKPATSLVLGEWVSQPRKVSLPNKFGFPGISMQTDEHTRLAHAPGAKHATLGDQNSEAPHVPLSFDLASGMEALFSKRLEALAQTEHAREEAARQLEESVMKERALARQQEETRVAEEARKEEEDRKSTLFAWGFIGVIFLIFISISVVAIVLDPHH